MLARRPRTSIPMACLLAAAHAGCGGAPPAPPAAAPQATVKASRPAELPPDLTPVADPDDLVVYGRVARPAASIATVSGWLRAQLPGVPPVGSEAVSELLAGESVGELVDLEQPIEIAATAAPKVGKSKGHFAVAAAVRSAEAAKAALGGGGRKLVAGSNGMLRVEGLGPPRGPDDEDDGEARACALVPSAGSAPMRFVCGFGPGSLEALAPWLTRTTPRQPSAADAHLEMRFAPMHKFVEQNRGGIGFLGQVAAARSGAGGDPAVASLITAFLEEGADLALDLERVTVDLRLADAGADLALTTKYRSTTSVVARLATYRPDRADVPPPAFLRLPGDAEAAFFARGVDPKDLERPRELVGAALQRSLEKEGLPAGDAKALIDALGKLVTGAPAVYGAGVDAAALDKALAAARDDAAPADAKGALRDALVGWRMVGYEESPARLTGALKEIAAAWARPAVAKWVKAQNKSKPATTLRIVPAGKGMPKDAVHLELAVFPRPEAPADKKKKAPPAPKAVRLHAYAIPDGATTWLALGTSDEVVSARARAVLAGADATGGLVKRPGLEAVREGKLHAGGFFTLQGLATTTLSLRALDGQVPRRWSDLLGVLGQGPGKGATPLPVLMTVTPAQGGGATAVGQLKLPRAAIEDAVRAAIRGAVAL